MLARSAKPVSWAIVGVLVLTVVVFATIRVMTDLPNIVSGVVPAAEDFEHRYARYPWLAYAHVGPGVLYLLLAPLQLWRGFRNRHLRWHRRIGRVAIISGLLSGIFAILFGFFLSFGGALQASAAVVFGSWFIFALVNAYRCIRRRNITDHRRWMIRAFAVGLAVGTIRIWIGLFQAFGLLTFRDAIGVAFWLSFVLHAASAEAWIWWRPSASGAPRTGRAQPDPQGS